MTVVTTRPDATESMSGVTVVGAANAHTALSDDSDTSYVQMDVPPNVQAYFRVGFAEPIAPADSKLKSIALRGRTRRVSGIVNLVASIIDDGQELTSGFPSITWTTTTTSTLLPATVIEEQPTDLSALFQGVINPGTIRFFELYLDTTYVEKPVTNVTAPTGTVSEGTNPPVSWENTLDSDGGAQTKAQIRVFTDAQYGAGGFDPATSAAFEADEVEGAGTTWTPDTTMPDDTYRAYVRVAQTVNGEEWWSDWDYAEFTIDVLRPGVPSVAATGEDDHGHVRIDVAASGGDTTTDAIQIQRSYDDGVTWVNVAGLDGGIVESTAATVYDYEAPNGLTAMYRARARHTFSADDFSLSEWSAVDTATWTDDRWWLKHPGHPSLNFATTARSQPGRQRAARRGVHAVLGRANPVPVYDARASATGELVLRLGSDAERAALEAILEDGAPLLVQAPPDTEAWPENGRWCAIGDLDGSRALDAAWGRYTFEGFGWEEVDRPEVVADVAN